MPPKRKVKRNYTHEDNDKTFWTKLERVSAYRQTPFENNNIRERLQKRQDRRNSERTIFRRSFVLTGKRGRRFLTCDITQCLLHWVKYYSWSHCRKCNLLCKKTLKPSSFNSKGVNFSSTTTCWCSKEKYVIPNINRIPSLLSNLSKQDEVILRIFEIDIGPKKIAIAGHRVKNGAFELRYRNDTVKERIDRCGNTEQKNRLDAAYNYLLMSSLSSYKDYLHYEVCPNNNNRKIKFWNVYKNFPGLECALWPTLYPYTSWCESILKGTTSRDSILHSFRCKLLSPILDYNNNFPLLQYHYDRWLYKTLTGAVECGKVRKASPRRALETKTFTNEYWQWQHRFLNDAVLQFGNPSLFLTISPYEWDFPKASWLQHLLEEQDLLPTACGAVETLHIAHILEQLCRGYITGVNSNEWEIHNDKHILYDCKHKKCGNVQCVFYRYEYQNRRSIHLHMLVWLRNIVNININRISATIPTYDEELAFLVDRLQTSDRATPFLHISPEATHVSNSNVCLKHTKRDAFRKLRPYIDSILPVIQSRMDVQICDGKEALMKYVSTYVTKLQHGSQILRSTSSSAFQVALPFLIDLQQGEPEMTMAFSSTNISYCSLSRIKLVPPAEQYFTSSLCNTSYLLAILQTVCCF